MVKAYRPDTLNEALVILSKEQCTVMAGGTDLMVQRAKGAGILPDFNYPLLFVSHLKELQKIYQIENEIHIGAASTLSDIMKEACIPAILKEMIGQMASPPTRNMATLAGNICNASPAGDTLPYLYAVDAKIVLESKKGSRTLTMDEFIIGLKKTSLNPNELVRDIIIPNKVYEHNYYRKLGQRKGMSLTKASMLGLANVQEGKVTDIRIALGSVSAKIVHSAEIENSIKGMTLQELQKEKNNILEEYNKLISPIDDARSTAAYRSAVSFRIINDFIESLNK